MVKEEEPGENYGRPVFESEFQMTKNAKYSVVSVKGEEEGLLDSWSTKYFAFSVSDWKR